MHKPLFINQLQRPFGLIHFLCYNRNIRVLVDPIGPEDGLRGKDLVLVQTDLLALLGTGCCVSVSSECYRSGGYPYNDQDTSPSLRRPHLRRCLVLLFCNCCSKSPAQICPAMKDSPQHVIPARIPHANKISASDSGTAAS